MMDSKYETLMMACRSMLSGGEWGNTDSLAPLICNPANQNYGKLVELKSSELPLQVDRVVILTKDGVDILFQQWTEEYEKVRFDCGGESLHCYMERMFLHSSLDEMEAAVLNWMNQQEEGW